MEENLTFKQELKKALYTFDPKAPTKRKVRSTTFKNSNKILTSLANQRELGEVRKRYKVHAFLKKVLIQKIMNYVLFAFYRNQKLSIAVIHPVAQSELNYQKKMIIKYAKMIKDFKDIKEVSVFRYDKLNKFSKDFDKNIHKEFTSPFSKKKKEEIVETYDERSHGIFENKIKDEKLHQELEKIREIINSS